MLRLAEIRFDPDTTPARHANRAARFVFAGNARIPFVEAASATKDVIGVQGRRVIGHLEGSVAFAPA